MDLKPCNGFVLIVTSYCDSLDPLNNLLAASFLAIARVHECLYRADSRACTSIPWLTEQIKKTNITTIVAVPTSLLPLHARYGCLCQ